MTILKRIFVVLIAAFLIVGAISSYRAWYQVKSLNLNADLVLHNGSLVETGVVSYGRTPVDVRVELIQGSKSETIGEYSVRGNNWSFFDPRTRHASRKNFLTQGVLSSFEPGKALLRATATGRPQWTRLPPPLIRETLVEIQH
jgi:hypothetical protein